jgi:hypothetical protein
MSHATRLSRSSTGALLALVFAASSASGYEARDKAKLLTRSIYVPVRFQLCEHLHDAVLYQGEAAVGVLPVKRIFQFTFYPHLERVEPVRIDIRVEGARADGTRFVGRLAVTPSGIHTATSEVALDLQAQLERLRYKLDVRYDVVELRLRCGGACERSSPAAIAVVAAGPEEP